MKSPNHWLQLIMSELDGDAEDEIPRGFKRATEIANEMGITKGKCCAKLKRAGAAGLVERKYFRRRTSRGIKKVPFYRPTPKPNRHEKNKA